MPYTLFIGTPTGGQYRIEPNGDIVRLDQPGFTASGEWKFLGLVSTGPGYPRLIKHDVITPEWLAQNTLLYKNGHPRYTVRDRDHGTLREWGNTHYHGVKTLTIVTQGPAQ